MESVPRRKAVETITAAGADPALTGLTQVESVKAEAGLKTTIAGEQAAESAAGKASVA